MSIINVSNTTQLLQALKLAHSGDTIALAPGTYSNVAISNLNIVGDVMITSKDPGTPAVITDLLIKSSSGLNFSNIEIATDPAKNVTPLQVLDSKDIHFDKMDVHGSMDDNPSNDVNAMMIRNSSDISVTNSEFQQFSNGIAHLDSDHLLISGNAIHDLRMDGIRGGGSSNVTITKNFFTNFFRQDGDHPDAIQFWNTNTTVSTHDITVSENVFVRGEGGPIQGIFITAQITKLPYLNVKITDNVMIGTMYHGITVAGGQGVLIDGNIVAGAADMNSRINLDNSSDVTLTDNMAPQYYITGTVEFDAQSNNGKIATPTDGGVSLLQQWYTTHGGLSATVADLLSIDYSSSTPDDTTTTDPLPSAPPPPPPIVTSPNLTLTGDAANNKLVGGVGNDTLTGNGGKDTLSGGAGNDTYVDASADTVVEAAGGGTDTVISVQTYTLGANVENLVLTGTGGISGTGNELNNAISGNAGANRLTGGLGNDSLSGGGGGDVLIGGAGSDTMSGGAGVDRFVFEAGGGRDVITDFGASGERDALDFSALTRISGFKAPTLVDSASGVTIHFSADQSVFLAGVHASDLSSSGTAFFMS